MKKGSGMIKTAVMVLGVFFWINAMSQTADTLSLGIDKADSIFLVHNYFLLAQRYQIEADRALVIQQKLWDNPEFSAEIGLNSVKDPKFIIGHGGESVFSIDQVIRMAGKRNKSVRLAELNADFSEAAFQELIRTLRLQLHSDFNGLYFQNRTLEVLGEQAVILEDIVAAYKRADSTGSVAHADFIRLMALQISLKNDYLSARKKSLELQQEIQKLLALNNPVKPVVDLENAYPPDISSFNISRLIDTAIAIRPDVRMADIDRQVSVADYSLQKALAVPDLHVGARYDQAGGVVPYYWGLTVGIDLPFWNRNKGNIRSSASVMKMREVQYSQQLNDAQTEVAGAYEKLKDFQEGFKKRDLKNFENSYRTLIENVTMNFAKGNISLLQFIDFFNSYSDNVKDLNDYYQSVFEAFSELEFSVGEPLNKILQ